MHKTSISIRDCLLCILLNKDFSFSNILCLSMVILGPTRAEQNRFYDIFYTMFGVTCLCGICILTFDTCICVLFNYEFILFITTFINFPHIFFQPIFISISTIYISFLTIFRKNTCVWHFVTSKNKTKFKKALLLEDGSIRTL